ncbi:hypothetical protein D9611_006361 [Ephemerocybe angulata]|uniref:J domain-containing protein n=1 Tax=Ephemerocybe angulata TaxID=980116 RepID=A0A8H5FGM0_9AGAR|nr:hypothetical protein D9611_006361 [Tulosesus angulatus]
MPTQRSFLTFYDVLGIPKDAATDEIRKAYRKRALETHPDKLDINANEKEKQTAERQFHKVNEAFQTLGDASKRRRYDALLAFRTDPTLVSEDSARRKADRHEWARQQEEMSRRRVDAFRLKMSKERLRKEETNDNVKEEVKEEEVKEEVKRKPEVRVKKVADVLQELSNENPDFAARREAILKRKAEREKAAKQLQTPPPTPTVESPSS